MTVTLHTGTPVLRHPVQRFGWPATLALHLVPAAVALALGLPLLLIPIQAGLLLLAGHRATGQWSPPALSFRRRLPARLYLTLLPSVAAIALGTAMLLDPGFPPAAAGAGGLALTLVVEGLLRPVVQEVYFRAYLLPRLPVSGGLAVLTSAGLSAAQYAWQPRLAGFMFIVQLLLTAVTVRLGSVRVAIAAQCLIGVAGALA